MRRCGFIWRARAGQHDSGDELTHALDSLKPPAWPAPVVELFLGKRMPDAVISAASNAQERCEAQFYVGHWYLLKYVGHWHVLHGERDQAAKALEIAAKDCPGFAAERSAATASLVELRQ